MSDEQVLRRVLPEQEKRVETGAIQFGDDWPGLFIRGDNCFALAIHLRNFLQNPSGFERGAVEGLLRLLGVASVDPQMDDVFTPPPTSEGQTE